LIAKHFQWAERPRCHNVGGFRKAFPKFLCSQMVNLARDPQSAHYFAQKGGLFPIAFNQVNLGAGRFCQRARNRDSRKAPA